MIHPRTHAFFIWLAVSIGVGAISIGGLQVFVAHKATAADIVFAFLWGGVAGIFIILPWGVLHLGIRKMREQRLRDFHALGDENTVTADPEGARKTHEFITALASTEARIGLLQRSEPYAGDKPQS